MMSLKRILVVTFLLSSVVFITSALVSSVSAEDSNFRKISGCKEYWAKREQVPVYAAAKEKSEIIAKLPTQEKVCVVGERADFYILDWENQEAINERAFDKKRQPEIAYIRKVDVIEAQKEEKDLYSRAKQQLDVMRSGVVPEDIYGPFRPVIDYFHSPTKCRAGKEVCARVEELQRDPELKQEEPKAKE